MSGRDPILYGGRLPATATVIGIVVLSQIPSWTEVLGVGLVVVAVAADPAAAEAKAA